MSEAQPGLDRAYVAAAVKQLGALDEHQFEIFFDRNINSPVPEMTVAFRSDELAVRSWQTAKKIVRRINNSLHALGPRNQDDADRKRRRSGLEHQRTLVAYEEGILKHRVDDIRLQSGGTLPTAPNARAQAARILQERHIVEFLNLVREREEAIKADNKAAAKARRAERVVSRQGSLRAAQNREPSGRR